MRFALDTNVVIALMKGHPGVLERLRQHGMDEIGLPSIVLHELYYGAARGQRSDANRARVDALPFMVLDLDREDARRAGEIRARLDRQGRPIGAFDALIAAQALARDLTLVTRNGREFQRVPGLRVADWESGTR